MASEAEQRMADWISSLDHPPTHEEKLAYITEAKQHPTATSPAEGWVLVGPIPDHYDPDRLNVYQILHESGDYGQTLLIHRAANGKIEAAAVADWVTGHIERRNDDKAAGRI